MAERAGMSGLAPLLRTMASTSLAMRRWRRPRRGWEGWCRAGIFVLVVAAAMPGWTGEPWRLVAADTEDGAVLAGAAGGGDGPRTWLLDTHLDVGASEPHAGQVAQASGSAPAGDGSGATPGASEASTQELNKQLSNPVTSLWSLTFQFNNFRLENGEWSNNLLFQPVLPVGLTREVNLITRPVLPLYSVVPHETGPGEVDHATGLGDMILLELLSPANSGKWILGAGPTLIFPTATSTFTGQGKWQAGPAAVVGYLTDTFIVGVFPQQWWSFAGDGDRPDTSQMNLQPFAAYFLGEGWSVGYSGNILADWKAPSSERWTVPVGLTVGKIVKFGRVPVKIQLAGQYMPVRPSHVGQEWNVQLQLTPVLPKLVEEPLFR